MDFPPYSAMGVTGSYALVTQSNEEHVLNLLFQEHRSLAILSMQANHALSVDVVNPQAAQWHLVPINWNTLLTKT